MSNKITPLWEVDPTTPTWRAIQEWAETRIAFARDALEYGTTAERTLEIRAELKVLRQVLQLGDVAQRTTIGSEMGYGA